MIKVLLSFLLITSFIILIGCGEEVRLPYQSDIEAISAHQVDLSMINKTVKVRDTMLWIVSNPGGLGGLYAQLGTSEDEVGVRIQESYWAELDKKQRDQFKEGLVVTVEGNLVMAGGLKVVVVNRP